MRLDITDRVGFGKSGACVEVEYSCTDEVDIYGFDIELLALYVGDKRVPHMDRLYWELDHITDVVVEHINNLESEE